MLGSSLTAGAVPLVAASSLVASARSPPPFFFDRLLEFLEAAFVSGGAAPGGSALPRAMPSLPGPVASSERLNELACELPSPLRE